MPYGVLARLEDDRTPEEIAASLRTIAADLEDGTQLTVTGDDGESATVDLPDDTIDYTVELERQPTDGGDDVGLAFALEWDEDAEMEFGLD
jgi:amphi-Trp domain-containing protein